jgi:chloride channel 2
VRTLFSALSALHRAIAACNMSFATTATTTTSSTTPPPPPSPRRRCHLPTYRLQFPGGDLSAEVIAYAALGILCGLMGSCLVYTVNKIRIARKLLMTTHTRRYIILAAVAAGVSSLTYATAYLRQSDKQIISDLFSDERSSPDGVEDMALWRSPGIVFSLIIFIGIKFFVTVTSISLPIACGLFIPLFVLGGAIGRLFGQLLALAVPSVVPGAYAVVGAAALVSGATHTVSTAVIVFELTGQVGVTVGMQRTNIFLILFVEI